MPRRRLDYHTVDPASLPSPYPNKKLSQYEMTLCLSKRQDSLDMNRRHRDLQTKIEINKRGDGFVAR